MSPVAKVANRFTHAAGDAVSNAGFFGGQLSHEFNRFVRVTLGIMPNWAIDKDDLVKRLSGLLPLGHTTALNAAAFLSVASVHHKHSRYDTVDFLNNFIRLYNADSFERVCEIEHIKLDSEEASTLKILCDEKGLEALKIRLWAKDLEDATEGTLLGRAFGQHKRITASEIETLVATYQAPANDNGKEADPSAFPREDYLTLLREMRKENRISETQTALILCFILHAKETRNDGTSYIKHPMAVADGVRKIGKNLCLNNEEIWQATLVALLHDGGEKTTLKIQEDLEGLLPQEIIDAIDAMHKRDGKTYFQYLERCCSNQLAAVVKLSDLAHNSSDSKAPSTKQAFVYPVSAAYVLHRIRNPHEKISVEDFATQHLKMSSEHFAEINTIAESKDKKGEHGNVTEKAAKKRKASEFPHLQTALNGVKSVGDIINGIIQTHANPRREEVLTLQP